MKHCLESSHNSEDPPKYRIEVFGTHLTAISRQLSEGLAIESHETEHLINGKGEYGDYFSTQLKQQKRAKKAASISTESLNLCNMPQTQHRHPGMQCTDTSFYSTNSCGSLNVKSSLDNRKGFDNNKKGITQSKFTKVFKFGSS